MVFWNTNGIRNLFNLTDVEIEEELACRVILCLSETWCTGTLEKLPRPLDNFGIIESSAIKEKSTRRASGGLAFIYDKERVTNVKILDKNEMWITTLCAIQNTKFITISLYIKNDHYRDRLNLLTELLEDLTSTYELIIGGDFNARIGSIGAMDTNSFDGTPFRETRNSLDEKLNTNGWNLLSAMENLGMAALNGRSNSDKVGEITYIGNSGLSTIDHIWTNANTLKHLSGLKVLSIGLSDHLPVKVILNKVVNQLPINRKESSKVLRASWTQEHTQELSRRMAINSEQIAENYREINNLNNCNKTLVQGIMRIAKETV